MEANTSVILFAIIIGKEYKNIPYNNHKATQRTKSIYIHNEIALVSFVLITFNTWGTNEIVVQNAAIYHTIST